MDVIRISAIAITPLFVFMMLGYYFKKKNYLSPSSTKQINILVFRYFLSIMCAETIYKANLKEDVELLPLLVAQCLQLNPLDGVSLTFRAQPLKMFCVASVLMGIDYWI